MNYDFWVVDCMKIFGRISGSVLNGEFTDRVVTDKTSSASGDIRSDRSENDCIFGYHVQLGVEYETCFCDYLFRARIGYESLQWNGWVGPTPAGDADDLMAKTHSTLGFHGLFAGISLGF